MDCICGKHFFASDMRKFGKKLMTNASPYGWIYKQMKIESKLSVACSISMRKYIWLSSVNVCCLKIQRSSDASRISVYILRWSFSEKIKLYLAIMGIVVYRILMCNHSHQRINIDLCCEYKHAL